MADDSGKDSRRARLLVLGAGAYQIPVMRTASRLGVEVIAVDRSDSTPGAAIADHFFAVDTADREAVAQIAIAEGVDGVIAPCTDVAVPTQAYVAAVIGASGPTVHAAEILTDKGRFRAYQRLRDLPRPRSVEVGIGSLEDVSLGEDTYVMKPARSSGSKGTFVVEANQIAEHLRETLSYCPDERFIVESFIPGEQGTVEGLWVDGQITLAVITERMTAAVPFVATLGHLWPSHFGEDICQRILDAIVDIFVDLRIPNSPFDCDFVVGTDGPVVLELTPRLGGNSLSKLVRAATGVDLTAEAVRLALPQSEILLPLPSANPLGPAVGVLVLNSPAPGQLVYDLAGEAALRAEPWLAEISWDFPIGTPVRAFANGRDRVGEALFVAPDRTILDQRQADIGRRLKLGL
jgi:biotin carboxylase